MLVRTRIYLGFLVLAIVAGMVGLVSLLAFQRVRASFEEVEASFPFLLATSRVKDIVSQGNALLSAYLLEERPEQLDELEASFNALHRRARMYLDAFRLGSVSPEFLAKHGELWEKENFPYPLPPLPPGTSLEKRIAELGDLQNAYETEADAVKTLWRERLKWLQTRNEKAVATDKLSASVFDFVKGVGEQIGAYATPLNEIYRSLFEAAFCGDPRGQIRKSVSTRFDDFRRNIQESAFSEQVKETLLAKINDFQGKCEAFLDALHTLEAAERSNLFLEFNLAHQDVHNAFQGLRIDRWVERLTLFDRERKNFLLLSGEEKDRAKTLADSVLGSVKRFFESDFPNLYAPQAVQAFVTESFQPLETSWQEVLQADAELALLEEKLAAAIERIQGIGTGMIQAVDAVHQEVLNLFASGMAQVESIQRTFTRILQLVALFVVIVAVVLGLLLSRSIVLPLRQGVALAQTLEQGDLTGCIEVTRKDEVGTLLSSLSQASLSLCRFLREVATTANEVIAAAENLHRTSREIAGLGDQVAQAVSQVARGSEEQNQNLTRIAHRMGELAQEVRTIDQELAVQVEKVVEALQGVRKVEEQMTSVRKNLEEVQQAAQSAFVATQEGQETLKDVVRSMQAIEASVFSVRDIAGKLGQSSQEIGSITDLITGIAEETNLLALNAAIEAARAGEAGRGFAVVAEEVRKLAEESAQAAQKIAALIQDVQREVKEAVHSVEESQRRVTEGNQAVVRAQNSFEEIYKANTTVTQQAQAMADAFLSVEQYARSIANLIQSIVTISEENKLRTGRIAKTAEEVSVALGDVASISEENAAAAQEVAASSEEQSAALQEIEKMIATMAERVQALEAGLARFKLS
ncbi:MAG: methyl-accepting chemotaxis protein [Candidatus Caldatribacterium sp.]|uniref:HAMP domain-containing methyl-accepting chemotaxis protein n=1 Tax=Candidatus Caldatribacterium sp. TaxID=2282143 RepID=UPI00299132CE|nr:methyl-accepting chemotaxis protein [Candidatus Caldatribacterium sp.]MCX7729880.1 methyl-accepting chemotaxis protein [Candidatus Caldatribacterium sp.]MDW8080943.1 methyl-accepting chemotaxis protein [Candidatus Calescibacterium sp.]